MKYVFSFLSCFAFLSAFAATIHDVEYHLPKMARDWEIGNKLENEKGTTIIYIPKTAPGTVNREFFGVSANYYRTDINNPRTIKDVLTKMYPDMTVDFQVLDKNDTGLIYEWSIKDNQQERAHGWGRVFAINEGTVVLSYQTENTSEVAKARSIWLPVLKEAQ